VKDLFLQRDRTLTGVGTPGRMRHRVEEHGMSHHAESRHHDATLLRNAVLVLAQLDQFARLGALNAGLRSSDCTSLAPMAKLTTSIRRPAAFSAATACRNLPNWVCSGLV